MNTFKSMQRQLWAILAVIVLTTILAIPAAQPALAADGQSTRTGTATIVRPKVETLRLQVVEQKSVSGELRYTPVNPSAPQASPLYPMWYYTCYFEGVKVPCSFFAWLWY